MKKVALWTLLFLLCVLLCSACGKEEGWEYGVDGFVYIPEDTVLSRAVGKDGEDFHVVGDSLYFTRRRKAIYRIGLDDGEDGAGETGELGEPGEAGEPGMEDGTSARKIVSAKGDLVCYTVDPEGNIYYIERKGSQDAPSYTLYQLDQDGVVVFESEMQGVSDIQERGISVDGNGTVYALCGNTLCAYGSDGSLRENISLEEYVNSASYYGNFLMKDESGRVLCVLTDGTTTRHVLALGGQGRKPAVVDALGGDGTENLFMTSGGLLADTWNDLLYSCGQDGEEPERELLLRWQDSDLAGVSVQCVESLPGGNLLVKYNFDKVVELKKTPVEELPQKELVVVASLSYNSQSLVKAIGEFNQQSDRYRVRLENFGGGLTPSSDANRKTNEEAGTRMDASLVSSAPPDLLDLSGLDIAKYAGKKVMADLSALIGEKETSAFLENMLEDYTVDGRLICIPTSFMLYTVACRGGEAGTLADGYDAGNLFETVKARREAGEGVMIAGDSLLTNFFAEECLTKYINWEDGSCNFDSGDFGKLLEWVRTCPGTYMDYGSLPEEVYLADLSLKDLSDILLVRDLLGDEPVLAGYPTADAAAARHRAEVADALGIVEKSAHKDGAAAFLEYYLTREADVDIYGWGFPSRRADLEELKEEAAKAGLITLDNGRRYRIVDEIDPTAKAGNEVQYTRADWQTLVDQVMDAIEAADFTPYTQAQENALAILQEESELYFNGQKSLKEVQEVINNRISNLVQEGL